MNGENTKAGSEANSAVKRLVNCPHCGGSSGYQYYVISKQLWTGSWAEPEKEYRKMQQPKEEFVDAVDDKTAKTVRCDDCGKRISRKLLGS
jgi:DNA-directed RNA polymerase subunit RPC12/RpoP